MVEEKTFESSPVDRERQERMKESYEELTTLHGALRGLQKDELGQWSAGFDSLFVKCRDDKVAERFIKFIKNHASDLHLGHCEVWESGSAAPARISVSPLFFWGGQSSYRMRGWGCVEYVHTLYFDLDKLETKEERAFAHTDFEADFGGDFPELDWRDYIK